MSSSLRTVVCTLPKKELTTVPRRDCTAASDANRPTLLKIALSALKNWHLEWSNEHLNNRPLTKNTPIGTYTVMTSTAPRAGQNLVSRIPRYGL